MLSVDILARGVTFCLFFSSSCVGVVLVGTSMVTGSIAVLGGIGAVGSAFFFFPSSLYSPEMHV